MTGPLPWRRRAAERLWRCLGGVGVAVLCALPVAGAEPGSIGATNAVAADTALWFPVGEDMIYRIYWGPIPVGISRVTSRWIERDGRQLIALTYRTKTNAFFDSIYPFDDEAESWVDPATFQPVQFRTRLKKRQVARDEQIRFDHERGKAVWTSFSDGQIREFTLDGDLRDLLSYLYTMRRTGLTAGEVRAIGFFGDHGPVYGTLTGLTHETVSLPVYGKVRCLKVKPRADFGGFLVSEGKVTAWISDDERRLCTRLVVNGLVDGRAVLCHVGGPGDDFWVRHGAGDTTNACPVDADIEAALRSVDMDQESANP